MKTYSLEHIQSKERIPYPLFHLYDEISRENRIQKI